MTPATIAILDEICASYPFLFAGPASEDEIVNTEKCIGMAFSPGYRAFLHRYGGALIGTFAILGVKPYEGYETVTEYTQRCRDEGWLATDGWLVVAVDGAGNPIGIAADGSIWISEHDGGSAVSKLADSFDEWLAALVKRHLP